MIDVFGFLRETYSNQNGTNKRIFIYSYEADAIEFFLLSLKKELTIFIDEKQEMSLDDAIDLSSDDGWEDVNFINLDREILFSIGFYNQPSTFRKNLEKAKNIFTNNLLKFEEMLSIDFYNLKSLKEHYSGIFSGDYGGGFTTLKPVAFNYTFLDSTNISMNENPMEI
jgi:hypothetical protein